MLGAERQHSPTGLTVAVFLLEEPQRTPWLSAYPCGVFWGGDNALQTALYRQLSELSRKLSSSFGNTVVTGIPKPSVKKAPKVRIARTSTISRRFVWKIVRRGCETVALLVFRICSVKS